MNHRKFFGTLFSSSTGMVNWLWAKILIKFGIYFDFIFAREMFLQTLPAFEVTLIQNFIRDHRANFSRFLISIDIKTSDDP